MAVKYAYLIFSLPFPFPREINTFRFDESTQLYEGNIRDQIHGPNSKHWQDWLGSLTWETLCKNKLILSTWSESENTEVLDKENAALLEKISTIFRILPLLAPLSPPFDEVFIFSGKGTLSPKGLCAEDIRSFSRVECWTRSYYNEHHWDNFYKWAENEVTNPSLLDTWRICYLHYNQLFIQGGNNRQIFEGYRSFEEAMRGTQLEFKMPNLVRALECIINCWGAEAFAKKVLFLTGLPSQTLPYSIATNTEELLRDLYQLRNDCSHGKPFAYSLEKSLKKTPDGELIAKYEFLAEWAARKVLNDSFINSTILQYTHNRDALVSAWDNNLIKPL